MKKEELHKLIKDMVIERANTAREFGGYVKKFNDGRYLIKITSDSESITLTEQQAISALQYKPKGLSNEDYLLALQFSRKNCTGEWC